MDTFFDENAENLVTYYVLPVLRMNKNSFGKEYYIDARINEEGTELYVFLDGKCPVKYWEFDNYKTDYNREDGVLIAIYQLPDQFSEDIAIFVAGQYSKLSEGFKDLIRKYSGLPYKQPFDHGTFTHKLLMALDNSASLRNWLAAEGMVVDEECLVLKDTEKLFIK